MHYLLLINLYLLPLSYTQTAIVNKDIGYPAQSTQANHQNSTTSVIEKYEKQITEVTPIKAIPSQPQNGQTENIVKETWDLHKDVASKYEEIIKLLKIVVKDGAKTPLVSKRRRSGNKSHKQLPRRAHDEKDMRRREKVKQAMRRKELENELKTKIEAIKKKALQELEDEIEKIKKETHMDTSTHRKIKRRLVVPPEEALRELNEIAKEGLEVKLAENKKKSEKEKLEQHIQELKMKATQVELQQAIGEMKKKSQEKIYTRAHEVLREGKEMDSAKNETNTDEEIKNRTKEGHGNANNDTSLKSIDQQAKTLIDKVTNNTEPTHSEKPAELDQIVKRDGQAIIKHKKKKKTDMDPLDLKVYLEQDSESDSVESSASSWESSAEVKFPQMRASDGEEEDVEDLNFDLGGESMKIGMFG